MTDPITEYTSPPPEPETPDPSSDVVNEDPEAETPAGIAEGDAP